MDYIDTSKEFVHHILDGPFKSVPGGSNAVCYGESIFAYEKPSTNKTIRKYNEFSVGGRRGGLRPPRTPLQHGEGLPPLPEPLPVFDHGKIREYIGQTDRQTDRQTVIQTAFTFKS